MTPQRLSLNPSSIKTRFTYGFIGALRRLNKHHRPASTSSSSSAIEICRRYRSVKKAADASMASAVGSGRAWSRAMLRKIHNRRRGANYLANPRRSSAPHGLRKRSGRGGNLFQANRLRKLVPGGQTMDLHSLFDETAHYIKCLTTQVQVMRNILDFCSTT
uniref:Putative transcription factor IBH1-like n=1 Tax=Davidia involucrata TaxID=16924 RepID=A0A5B7BCH5_DAVIN